MNKELMLKVGFKKEVELVETGKCPFCAEPINLKDFTDKESLREFSISGICQSCQDTTFNPTLEEL